MGGAWVVNRLEQSRASLVCVYSPHMDRLEWSRPASDELDICGCHLEMFRDRTDHRLIGAPALGRARDADLEAGSKHAGKHVSTSSGHDLQVEFDTVGSSANSRDVTHAGCGMIPPRSSSGRSSERGCSGGGVLSDFLASSLRRSATVAFSSTSPLMIRSMSSF